MKKDSTQYFKVNVILYLATGGAVNRYRYNRFRHGHEIPHELNPLVEI